MNFLNAEHSLERHPIMGYNEGKKLSYHKGVCVLWQK